MGTEVILAGQGRITDNYYALLSHYGREQNGQEIFKTAKKYSKRRGRIAANFKTAKEVIITNAIHVLSTVEVAKKNLNIFGTFGERLVPMGEILTCG